MKILMVLQRHKKIPILFCAAVFFFLFIKAFVLDIKFIKGSSMEPALHDGSIAVIFKAAYGIKMPLKNYYLLRWANPAQDDMVIFFKNGRFIVKRCIATSGEPIEFIGNLGYTQNLHYAMKAGGKNVALTGVQFRNLGGMSEKKAVPDGTILVLGDNLNSSYDSRDYGFIFADAIIGKVLLWK